MALTALVALATSCNTAPDEPSSVAPTTAGLSTVAAPANDNNGTETVEPDPEPTSPEGPAGSEDAATSAVDDPLPGTDGNPGPDTIDWQPCGGLDCGSLVVPLDHDQAGGDTIELALIRRPALGVARGTIFVNPGGPGASGYDFVANGFTFDQTTMTHYDLVGFDPRGVGRSRGLECPFDRSAGPLPDASPDSDAELAALVDLAEELARTCGAGEPALLHHVDTGAVAHDLDLARAAVGDERLHYYGFSFGSLIGLVYAEAFPDRVGHMVLDGIVDPTAPLDRFLLRQAIAFENAFSRLDQRCGTDLDCPLGGLAAAYDRVAARLDADGPEGEVGPTELAYAALASLYDSRAGQRLADAVAAADRGDLGPVEALSDGFVAVVRFAPYAAVECSDGPRPVGLEQWRRFAADTATAAPRFGPLVVNELLLCAYWPVGPGPARAPISASGAPPIVVIGNTGDPATPLADARTVADALDRSSLVVVRSDDHTAYQTSLCVQVVVRDYLVDDIVPAPVVDCPG